MTYAVIIFVSVLYGIALAVKVTVNKHKGLSEFADNVFAFACITSVSFMSAVFEINRYVEYLCIAIMLILVIGIPFITRLVKGKASKKDE